MATSAISGADLTLLTTKNLLITPRLYVVPKTIMATARVNAPGGITYPTDDIPVDGWSFTGIAHEGEIPPGALVWIGSSAGAYDIYVGSLQSASSAAIEISGIADGDPGVARYQHQSIPDNAYVSILAFFPLWGQLSRVTEGGIDKFFDETWNNHTSNPSPVGNIGPWEVAFITSGSTVDVDLTAANSFTWASKTIDNWAWEIRRMSDFAEAGYTVQSGTVSSESLTIRCTAGVYFVRCIVQDDANAAAYAYKYLFVDDGTLALSGWQIHRDDRDVTGRRVTVRMQGSVAESAVFPGTAFLYHKDYSLSGESASDGVLISTFVGFIDEETGVRQVREQGSRPVHTQYVEFDLLGPGHVLDKVPAVDQLVKAKVTPSEWHHILRDDMSYVDGWIWYILRLHAPNVLRLFDFDPSDLTGLQDKTMPFGEGSILAQLREICPYRVVVGCRSDGTLVAREWPVLMTDAELSALGEIITWLVTYMRQELSHALSYRLKTGMVKLGSNAYDPDGNQSTFYLSLGPGEVQAQAVRRMKVVDRMLVTATGAAGEANRIAGHLFAHFNSPNDSLVIHTIAGWDICDPVDMIPHRLTVDAAYNPRSNGLDMQVLPTRVSNRWVQKGRALIEQIDIDVMPITRGTDGTTTPIPETPVDDPAWDDPHFPPGMQIMAAFDDNGDLYVTEDYQTPSWQGGPTWSSTALGLNGTPLAFVVQAASYDGNGTINGWVVTSTKIYFVEDIFGTPSATDQHTFRDNVGALEGREIDASFSEDGFVICTSYYTDAGTYVSYTTDGENWTEVLVTNQRETGGQAGNSSGIYVSSLTAGKAICMAFKTQGAFSAAEAALYRTDDYGATWDEIDNSPSEGPSATPGDGMSWVHLPFHDNANERKAYWGQRTLMGAGNGGYFLLYRTEADGMTETEISPQEGDWKYGPRGRWSVGTCPINRQRLALAGQGKDVVTPDGNTLRRALHVSRDGGESWDAIWGPGADNVTANSYLSVAISGSDEDTLYAWGSDGMMGYSDDFENLDDRRGNLAALGAGTIIGICGG